MSNSIIEMVDKVQESKSFPHILDEFLLISMHNLLDMALCKNLDEPTPIEYMFFCLYELSYKNSVLKQFKWNIEFQKSFEVDGNFYRADFFLYKTGFSEGLIIELDGHEFHEKTKEQAKKDKKRDRELQQLNHKVYHYTGSEVWNNFQEIFYDLENFVLELDVRKGRISKFEQLKKEHNRKVVDGKSST